MQHNHGLVVQQVPGPGAEFIILNIDTIPSFASVKLYASKVDIAENE